MFTITVVGAEFAVYCVCRLLVGVPRLIFSCCHLGLQFNYIVLVGDCFVLPGLLLRQFGIFGLVYWGLWCYCKVLSPSGVGEVITG